MRSVSLAFLATGAVAAGLVLAPAASAATPDTACSNGPYSSATVPTGTVYGCTTRVSQTSANGDEDGTAQRPRISEDGRHVVFQSAANNLVPGGPTNGTHDFWVTTGDPAGTISLVDVAADGRLPNGTATFCDVSGDGRYVVFFSTATNLVAGRTTRSGSVFLRDMTARRTVEVPTSSTGGSTNGYSTRPTISGYPDSSGNHYVTYNSKGTNLVSGATHVDDVYVTRVTPALAVSRPALVSSTSDGGASDGQNEHAEISSDGTAITWQSTALNLDARANGKSQIYESGNPLTSAGARPMLVSVGSGGTTAGNAPSTRPAINGNGDEVAWESTASNLIVGDTNGALDAFVRGTATGAVVGGSRTVRVSVSYTGDQLGGASQRPNLNGRGDKVAFAANSNTVVKGDRNGQRDVFLRDLATGRNRLVDVCRSGGFGGSTTPCPATAVASARSAAAGGPFVARARAGGEDLSSRAFLSYDGNTVAFISGMADLVPQDGNASVSLDDVFVRTFTG